MDLYDIRRELNSGKSIYDLKLRVTYYARVSTDTDEQAHSLQNQINFYSSEIIKNPNWDYVEGYVDEGLSGTSVTKRDAFLKMIDDAKKRKFDFIITKEISRFSRNTLDSIKFTQQLLSYGVGVLFQSDNINTLMPDAELRLTIMSSIAQDEVRKISERVKFGFKRAIENGVVLGNSKIWGYKKENGKLIIDEKEAIIIRKIFDLYANQKMGIRAVSTKLETEGLVSRNGNPFSFSTIRNIIINPKYKGFYCGGKTHKYDYKLNARKFIDEAEWTTYKDEDNVPAIVSEELWEKANFILKGRSEKMSAEDKTSYQNKFTYSGKIVCPIHNVSYYRSLFKYKSGDKEVWQCKKYIEKGKTGCTNPTIYTAELDEIMRECFGIVFTDKARIIKELNDVYGKILRSSSISEDIKKEKQHINDIIKRKDKLLDLSINGNITDEEFTIRNNKFNDEIETIKVDIVNLEEQQFKQQDIEYTLEKLNALIEKELDFEGGFNDGLVDALLEKIEVHETEEKNKILVKVFFKVALENKDFELLRKRGNQTSVCIKPYI